MLDSLRNEISCLRLSFKYILQDKVVFGLFGFGVGMTALVEIYAMQWFQELMLLAQSTFRYLEDDSQVLHHLIY